MNSSQIQRLIQQGLSLQRAGKLAEAGAVFGQLRRSTPSLVEAWQLGGTVALLSGDPRQAAELYRRAQKLAPRSAVVATCLGVAEMALGNLVAAESHLRTAVALEPSNAEVMNQLATVLQQRGRHAEALQCHQRAVKLRPNSAQAWHGQGAMLSFLNRSAEAVECERRAIALDPDYLPARHGHAVALQKCHRIAEAVAEFDAILAQHPERLDVHSHRLLALHYVEGISEQELFRAHRQYGERAEAGVTSPRFANLPEPSRKLRVALFSADFRRHAVASFLLPILRHLDRDSFELLLYSGTTEPDAVTAQFRVLASVWRDISSHLDSIVEPLVRQDAPDLAIDLGGHTGTANLLLFARRIAPVQITYLGYPDTTGLTTMDYRFVDEITDPSDIADQFATEKLVRFAPTAWVYEPPAEAPVPAPPPCQHNGYVTFGSFNNFSKVTDQALAMWGRLLATVPNSRLYLKSVELATASVADEVRRRLQKAGVPLSRATLAGSTATIHEHLAAYSQIDIALDTWPYSGTTTTCEALWMGVPVVTLLGKRHSARVSASLLRAVGHPEWVTATPEHYLSCAADMAEDRARLGALRETLRATMSASVLLDHRGQSERFAAALRTCWQTWCAAQR